MLKYKDYFDEDECCGCCPCPPKPCPPKPYPPKPYPPKPCPPGPRGATGPKGEPGTTGPTGPAGPAGATGPYLSSYLEAVGSTQTVNSREDIAFDINEDYIDIAGNDIEVNETGTVFTINRPGLYHVEWSLNLASGTPPILIALMENGEPTSALSHNAENGNFSSGALINVTDVPFTISLQNYSGGEITVEDPEGYENTAASIRILRFADGPNS